MLVAALRLMMLERLRVCMSVRAWMDDCWMIEHVLAFARADAHTPRLECWVLACSDRWGKSLRLRAYCSTTRTLGNSTTAPIEPEAGPHHARGRHRCRRHLGAEVSRVIVSPLSRMRPSFWLELPLLLSSTVSSRTRFMYSSKPWDGCCSGHGVLLVCVCRF